MTNLVPPHGRRLSTRLVTNEERDEALSKARSLLQVKLGSREVSDLIMIAMGAFSPLRGFVGKEDYQSIVAEMRLKSGLLWPIPITLSVSKEEADMIKEGAT